MAHLRKLIPIAFTPLLLGGTCSEAAGWRDVSGTWVNTSFGPERGLGSDPAAARDLDLVLVLEAAVPTDRTPRPVSGRVCVIDRAGLGADGTYTLDPNASTWAGADYGGARLDLVATAADGRTLKIAQAHMANATPDTLDNSIITWRPTTGPASTFSFEQLERSGNAPCPAAP
jgi:hypothetical protein